MHSLSFLRLTVTDPGQIQLTITYAETLISLSCRLQWKPSLQPRGNGGIRYNRLFDESTRVLARVVSTVDPHVCLSCGALFSVSSIFGDDVGLSNCPGTAVPHLPPTFLPGPYQTCMPQSSNRRLRLSASVSSPGDPTASRPIWSSLGGTGLVHSTDLVATVKAPSARGILTHTNTHIHT